MVDGDSYFYRTLLFPKNKLAKKRVVSNDFPMDRIFGWKLPLVKITYKIFDGNCSKQQLRIKMCC